MDKKIAKKQQIFFWSKSPSFFFRREGRSSKRAVILCSCLISLLCGIIKNHNYNFNPHFCKPPLLDIAGFTPKSKSEVFIVKKLANPQNNFTLLKFFLYVLLIIKWNRIITN